MCWPRCFSLQDDPFDLCIWLRFLFENHCLRFGKSEMFVRTALVFFCRQCL